MPPLIHRLFWIWDGEFCGTISLRFQSGTEELPPHVSGHVGYSVVPWKQRHGYATEGARAALDFAFREVSIQRVVSLIRIDNTASERVARRLGGRQGTTIDFLGGATLVYVYHPPETDA